MEKTITVYAADEKQLSSTKENLKQRPCPFCKRVGTLNAHSYLKGYDPGNPQSSKDTLLRGQRVFCKKRKNKPQDQGCGKTFSILFSYLLKGFLICAHTVSKFLVALKQGPSIQRAWQSLCSKTTPFVPECAYRLVSKLKTSQSYLRTLLLTKQPPPHLDEVKAADPLLESINHLMNAFAESPCAVTAFQHHFQKEFFSD